MSRRQTPSTLLALLLTLAVAVAAPMAGAGIGWHLANACVVTESVVAQATDRGPLPLRSPVPGCAVRASAPAAADVALALRAPVLLHTTALPPPHAG